MAEKLNHLGMTTQPMGENILERVTMRQAGTDKVIPYGFDRPKRGPLWYYDISGIPRCACEEGARLGYVTVHVSALLYTLLATGEGKRLNLTGGFPLRTSIVSVRESLGRTFGDLTDATFIVVGESEDLPLLLRGDCIPNLGPTQVSEIVEIVKSATAPNTTRV